MEAHRPDELIPDVIAEFSQVFAFARTRWARYAEEVHPELRAPGMMILQTILRKGPITATGLGALLDMDKAMVSRQVSKLRGLGLVDAEEAESDRRVILLTASTEAHAAIEGLQARTAEEYRARFAGWSDEDIVQLRALLHRFNAQADDARGDGPARRCSREAEAGTQTSTPRTAYSPE